MHPLNVVFWICFASIAALVGWSFLRTFLLEDLDERSDRAVEPPVHGAGTAVDATGGAEDMTSGSMSGLDHGDSVGVYDGGSMETAGSGSEGGEGNGGEGRGDSSGGGGDSGGGGGGGW